MEQVLEYLIPLFVILYFAVSTVIAVLRRLATPPLPWPAAGPDGEAAALPHREEPRLPVERPQEVGEVALASAASGAAELAPAVKAAPGRSGPLPDDLVLDWSEPQEPDRPESLLKAVGPAKKRRQRLRARLRTDGLREAVLLAEVIGPPRALRPYTPPPLGK